MSALAQEPSTQPGEIACSICFMLFHQGYQRRNWHTPSDLHKCCPKPWYSRSILLASRRSKSKSPTVALHGTTQLAHAAHSKSPDPLLVRPAYTSTTLRWRRQAVPYKKLNSGVCRQHHIWCWGGCQCWPWAKFGSSSGFRFHCWELRMASEEPMSMSRLLYTAWFHLGKFWDFGFRPTFTSIKTVLSIVYTIETYPHNPTYMGGFIRPLFSHSQCPNGLPNGFSKQ